MDDEDYIAYLIAGVVLVIIVAIFIYFMVKRKQNRDRRAHLHAAFVASASSQQVTAYQVPPGVYTVPNVHPQQQQHNGYPIITQVSYVPHPGPNITSNEYHNQMAQPPPYNTIADAPVLGVGGKL